MRKWQKIGLLIIVSIALALSSSLYFTGSSDYSDPEKVEAMLRANCENGNHCAVPVEWYSTNGWMQPSIAGIVDGAYNMGYSLKDLGVFISDYAGSDSLRTEINTMVAELIDNPEVLWETIKGSTKTLGNELRGNYGTIQGQYKTGRALFEATTFFVGVGEVSASVKGSKLTVYLRHLTKWKRIRLECAICAKFFKKAYKLRKQLLQGDNLKKTKALLNNDWLKAKKAGKSWNEFIGDYQAHHIIPIKLLEESDALKFYYNNGGKLDFNSIENGIMIKKSYLGGAHANHPAYSNKIRKDLYKMFDNAKERASTASMQMKLFERSLIDYKENLRVLLQNQCIHNNVKVNQLFN